MKIYGGYPIAGIEIHDYKTGESGYEYQDCDRDCIYNEDSLKVSFKWLKVKTKRGSQSLELTAEPMAGKKKRELYIDGSYGFEYALIKVVQE